MLVLQTIVQHNSHMLCDTAKPQHQLQENLDVHTHLILAAKVVRILTALLVSEAPHS